MTLHNKSRANHNGWKEERVKPNPFVHVKLMSTDVGEGTGGGMIKTVQPDSPSYWMAYVYVGDAVVTTEKARSLGVTICKEVTEITSAR